MHQSNSVTFSSLRNLISVASVLIFSSMTFAHQARDGGGPLKIGKCYASYLSGYLVIAKIDKYRYQLAGNWMSPRAVLETRQISTAAMSKIKDMGPLNMNLKYQGTRQIQLQNGFEEEFDLWTDCSSESNDTVSASPTSPSKDTRQAGKSDLQIQNCFNACVDRFLDDKGRRIRCQEKCLK